MNAIVARGRAVGYRPTGRTTLIKRAANTQEPLFHLDDGVPYKRVGTREMTLQEWAAIQSNPRQRDEKVRIEKNRVGHLLEFTPKHAEVAIGFLPNGACYKLDGHTRQLVWSLGLARAPDMMTVDIYHCAGITAITDLYDYFDNSASTESGTDRVTGAYREAGISPTSPMLREGGISAAIRSLYHYLHRTAPTRDTKNDVINKGVKLFAPEIMLLDAINPTRFMFPTGIVMGALLTLGDNDDTASRFWSAYMADAGWKDGDRVDSVFALAERRKQLRGKSHGVRDTLLMSCSVAAYQGFQKRNTYRSKYLIAEKSKDLLRKFAEDVMAKKEGR